MKKCRDCGEEKPKSDFINNKGFSDGKDTLCLVCNSRRVQAWRKANPEKRAKQAVRESKKEYTKNKFLKYYYGITLEDYNHMFLTQQGCCAICGVHQSEVSTFHVDHDHLTGEVRGLLCRKCNHLLGNAQDNIETLEAAIRYLK